MAVLAVLWSRVRLGVIAALALYALVLFCAWVFQRRMIYFPDTDDVALPAGPAYEGLRDVTLQTEDGVTLKAWYWPGRKPGTLLMFHGNAGNRGGRLGFAHGIHGLGYGILLPDYRGYGGSGGAPSEDGFYRDAECCLAWLEEEAPGRVVYLGSSIGSGVACELALREPPAGMILQSAFSSLVDVARGAYRILPVGLFLKDRFENTAKIERAACPLLMIHGDADRIAPIGLARDLYEKAREPKAWIEVPGAGHNDLVFVAGPSYWEALRRFLDTHLAE